jgi:hypothetical protein
MSTTIGLNGDTITKILVAPTNPQYYVDNHDPSPDYSPYQYTTSVPPYAAAVPVYNLQYDGFTMVLTAQTNIAANITYHVKIAIEDSGGDDKYDSAVFIKAWSSCP